jgi:hypothetical protein
VVLTSPAYRLGELAAMTGVSAVALYEPGAAVALRTRVRWKSKRRLTAEFVRARQSPEVSQARESGD